MELLSRIFFILFGINLVSTATYLILLMVLFGMLENNYPEKYKELGEPSMWWNNSPRNGIRVIRFLLSNDPLFKADKKLQTIGRLARFFLYSGLTLFLGLVVLFFLFTVFGIQI